MNKFGKFVKKIDILSVLGGTVLVITWMKAILDFDDISVGTRLVFLPISIIAGYYLSKLYNWARKR